MTKLVIEIDMDGDAYLDRTGEELRRVLFSVTDEPRWSDLADGMAVTLTDSDGRETGFARVDNE